MSIAPAPQLAAFLEVLYRATIEARLLGYEGSEQGLPPVKCEQLAALMDAVHNLPAFIAERERCDESILREMLRDYDLRWNYALLHTYDQTVAERSRSRP